MQKQMLKVGTRRRNAFSKRVLLSDFGDKQLEKRVRETYYARLELRDTTMETYVRALARFCQAENVKPFEFEKLGLEEIEERTELFIRRFRNELAPKYLNIVYSAVKGWAFCTRMIKSRKLFREIKFDKSSRKFDAMTESGLETQHVKKLFDMCDIHEKVLLGLYGFCGLRPAIIPQLTVGDFAPSDYVIENGKLRFTKRTPFLFIPKTYRGNKARITFFTIVSSRISELVETALNNNAEAVTKQTRLLPKYHSDDGIFVKLKAMLRQIGFNGRPYLLRSFADKLLDRNLRSMTEGGETKRDEDLKEFMMGHKGRISSVYQLKALTSDDSTVYRKMYEPVDKWLNQNIFGVIGEDDYDRAKIQAKTAEKFGVDADKLKELLAALNVGKITMQQFDETLTSEANAATARRVESQFETLFKNYVATHSNSVAPQQ